MNKLKIQSSKLKVKTQIVKFLVLSFSFALCTLHFALYTVFAQSISSTELINNAKQYDGKIVNYTGEVIGDIMKRAQFAWINLNDGDRALGVWVARSLLKDISYEGSYKSRGDEVEAEGVFHRACPEHGGDLDIHAQGIRKVSSGRIVAERFNFAKRNLAIILFGVLISIWILSLLKRK